MSCKRIIGGKTDNTETATLAAVLTVTAPTRISMNSTKTRHGAYFRYSDPVDDSWHRSAEPS